MNAGQLDKLVTIMRPNGAVDNYGAPAPVVTQVAKVWAQKMNKSAKEVQVGSEQQVNNTLWRMWPTDITNNDEIHWDGKVYRVNAVVSEAKDHIMVHTTAAL